MRQLGTRLHGLVLIAPLLGATLLLQGCEEDQEEEPQQSPPTHKDAHKVENLAASEDSSGKQGAMDRVPIVERHQQDAHDRTFSFGGPDQSPSGPSSKLVLINASNVRGDSMPGQGDRLLDHERAFERALMSGSGAARQVHMLNAEQLLQDYYAHTSTTSTTTTTTTSTATTTTTATRATKKYYMKSAESASATSTTKKPTTTTAATTTTTQTPGVFLPEAPANKVGESSPTNATHANMTEPVLVAEELALERSKKLAPQESRKKVLQEANSVSPSAATFSAPASEGAGAQPNATDDSETTSSTENNTTESTATESTATESTATESTTTESTATESTATESTTTKTTTAETPTNTSASASSKAETQDSEDEEEEEEALRAEDRAEKEAIAKEKAMLAAAKKGGKPENSAGSDEDEDFEDSGTVASSPKPSEAADLLQLEDGDLPGDKDATDIHRDQSVMQQLEEGESAEESEEDDQTQPIQATRADRLQRLHQDRTAMLELQLHQDQQLDELRRQLQRHQDEELERFRQQQQKELEVLRLDALQSLNAEPASPSMNLEHPHARHKHGSRKMGHWLQEIAEGSKM